MIAYNEFTHSISPNHTYNIYKVEVKVEYGPTTNEVLHSTTNHILLWNALNLLIGLGGTVLVSMEAGIDRD